ncbi:hypothetical protein DHU18_23635 [Salmonella enterica]|nr:hypothetical protein [Salmonella enterica]ECE1537016.1 hypothetical protein [Salmonella enterica]ECU0525873.1 hypothetical protein [Salmonella enterica]EHD9854967.1 hypothetical protein [Salmonella enterica]
MIKFKALSLVLLTYSISAFSSVTDDDFDRCSQFLDKIVASSNASLIKELKVDRSFIKADVDRVSGSDIYAKVQFNERQSTDTPGEGFLLWMKYDYLKFNLEDVTIDLDNPEKLKFDNRYAPVYLDCLNKKIIYKVNGDSRLQFYKDDKLLIPETGVFILPGEYVEVEKNSEGASNVKYQAKDGTVYSSWVDSSRLQEFSPNTVKY